MKQVVSLACTSILYTALSILTSASAQTTADVRYKIEWSGPEHTALSAAYAVMEQDGPTLSKSFNDELPLSVELAAPPYATVTASGASLDEDVHVIVRIYRNDRMCDETVSYGSGNYATAFCSPSR